jgi:subtilase family serine protease
VNLELDGTGSLPHAQIESLTSGRIVLAGGQTWVFPSLDNATDTEVSVTRARAEFPVLTTLKYGSLTLSRGASLDVPELLDIDGASLYAGAGTEIRVPKATSYAHAGTGSSQHRVLRAEGVGAVIDLSNVTTITGGTSYNNRLFVYALSGGQVDLRDVASIMDPSAGDLRHRSIDVVADGVGSQIRLDALTEYTDNNAYDFGDGRYSTLTARGGGTVQAPNLTALRGVNLALDGTGTLQLGKITSLTSGRVLLTGNAEYAFPNLTDAAGTDFQIDKATVDVLQVSRIDGATFRVTGGTTLSLPLATSYAHASTGNNQHRSWVVEGPGSRLNLPGLTTITGGTHYHSRLFFECWSGGEMDLSGVTQIIDPDAGDTRLRAIGITVEGVGSRIALPSLEEFSDRRAGSTSGDSLWSSITVRYEGQVELRSNSQTELVGVDVNLGRQGMLNGNVQVDIGSRIRGAGVVQGNVVNQGVVAPDSHLTVQGDFVQEATGRLELEIGGSIPVAEHDVLTVGGLVGLGGAVRLTRTNNFSPQEGDSFRVATFAGRGTQQPVYEGLDFGGDAELSPELSYTDLTFVVGFSSGPSVIELVPVDAVLDPSGGPYFDVVFDEPVDPATFTADDVVLLGPDDQPVTILPPEPLPDDPKRFRIRLAPDGFQNGTYHVTIGPEVADFVGNFMNQNGNQVNGEPEDAFIDHVVVQLPDLIIDALSVVPNATEFGAAVQVDWQVHNGGPVAVGGAWTDGIYLSTDATLSGDDLLLDAIPVGADAPLAAGDAYMRSVTVTLPLRSDLEAGDFFILVKTDHADGLAEVDASNNTANTSIQLSMAPTPDLIVQDVSAPTDARPGETISVIWTGRNQGTAAADGPWVDRVYLSLSGQVAGATYVGSFQRSGQLAIGQTYSGGATFTVPSLLDDAYHVIVVTDALDAVFEGVREDNNTAEAAERLEVRSPDLAPNITDAPAEADTGDDVVIRWSVTNQGTAATIGGWTDRVYLSTDNVLSSGDRLLGQYVFTGSLTAGTATSAELTVTLPPETVGTYFFLIATDVLNQVVEPGAEANNTAMQVVALQLAPYADLAVSDVTAPAQTIGDPASVTVGWTVSNLGTGPGRNESWVDAVIASTNDTLGDGDDVVLARFPRTGALEVGESYSRTETFLLPPEFTGRYRLFVKTDADGQVFENGLEANNVAAASGWFDVMPIPYADLQVSTVALDGQATSGQPLPVHWTVVNQGIGLTSVGSWFDTVYLALDSGGQQRIDGTYTSFEHFGHVAIGGGYDRTGAVPVPEGLSGTVYVVVTAADRAWPKNTAPFEFLSTTNNTHILGPIDVVLSDSPDLEVTMVTAPAEADEGGVMDVTWSVTNAGSVPAQGDWTDRVYLEQVGVDDPQQLTLGTFRQTGEVAAGMSYSRTEQVRLPIHIQGLYRVVVATNFRGEVYEPPEAMENNRRSTDPPLAVRVKDRSDLQVDADSIDAPAEISAGGVITVGFEVVNLGRAAASGGWFDRVYLSLDNQLSHDDLLLAELPNVTALAPTERYASITQDLLIPQRYRETVYLLIQTDARKQVDEWPNEDNNIVAHPLYITPLPLADLVVHDVVAPNLVIGDAEIPVQFTVTNLGSGATNVDSWIDTIWLTRDRNRPHPGHGDLLLKSLTHTGILEREAGYDVVATVRIPQGIDPGVWYITPWTDPYGAVLEDTLAENVNPDDPHQIDNNNYKAQAVDVLVDRPDLEVVDLTADLEGLGGTNFYFSYRVVNRGNGPATGVWTDRVYLSELPDPFAEGARALLVGEFPRTDPLDVDDGYTIEQQVMLSPSAVGSYLVVVADAVGSDPVYRSLKESNESNNRRFGRDEGRRAVPAFDQRHRFQSGRRGVRKAQSAGSLGPGFGSLAQPRSRPSGRIPRRRQQHHRAAPAGDSGQSARSSGDHGRCPRACRSRADNRRHLHGRQSGRGHSGDAEPVEGSDLFVTGCYVGRTSRPVPGRYRSQNRFGCGRELHANPFDLFAQRPDGAVVCDRRDRPCVERFDRRRL